MGEVDHPEPVVVLADGLFPTHPVPLTILTSAGTLICCDGATDKALAAGCTPTLVIGDLDSLQADRESLSGDVIWDNGQENTDLEKAIERCINNGISEVTLLGITGLRDDHTLANLHLLANFSGAIRLTAVTDFFTIIPLSGEKKFEAEAGRRVSLHCLGKSVKITTDGLKYDLHGEMFSGSGHGMSNEATGDSFTVTAENGTVLVFVSHPS